MRGSTLQSQKRQLQPIRKGEANGSQQDTFHNAVYKTVPLKSNITPFKIYAFQSSCQNDDTKYFVKYIFSNRRFVCFNYKYSINLAERQIANIAKHKRRPFTHLLTFTFSSCKF